MLYSARFCVHSNVVGICGVFYDHGKLMVSRLFMIMVNSVELLSGCVSRLVQRSQTLSASMGENIDFQSPQFKQLVSRVEEYITDCHAGRVSWHVILNNNSSTRSKAQGGPAVPSVSKCKSCVKMESDTGSARYRCRLVLPHSFVWGDCLRIETEGWGDSANDASESACRQAVAVLLTYDARKFVLRPNHWKISTDQLVQGLPGVQSVQHALPLHQLATSQQAGSLAQTLTPEEVKNQVASLIRRCLKAYNGEFDPAFISRRRLGQFGGEEPVYSQLNKLLLRGELRSFIENHGEFSWRSHGSKGMIITWAHDDATHQVPRLSEPALGQSAASDSLPGNLKFDIAD